MECRDAYVKMDRRYLFGGDRSAEIKNTIPPYYLVNGRSLAFLNVSNFPVLFIVCRIASIRRMAVLCDFFGCDSSLFNICEQNILATVFRGINPDKGLCKMAWALSAQRQDPIFRAPTGRDTAL